MSPKEIVSILEALEAGAQRDDVFARAGVTPATWCEALAAVVDALQRERSLGERALTERFIEAFEPSDAAVDHTAVLTAAAVRDATLPFRGADHAPHQIGEAIALEGRAMKGETTFLAALSDDDHDGTLPFNS